MHVSRAPRTIAALAGALAVIASVGEARAADATSVASRASETTHEGWFRLTGTLGAGMGLRFNNPYRLATPLGSDAESISRTAAYLDVGVGAAFGEPTGATYGPVLRWDHALQGVGQDVITPSFALGRRRTEWEAWARVGLPIVLGPDANVGGELAAGGAWFATAGLGGWAELVGDLFVGAATPENKLPRYPVLSLQLGVVFEWERLP
jgi:hypothetical protein